MTEKLTPWFRGAVKPVRVGVYERQLMEFGGAYYSYWDGLKWYGAKSTIELSIIAYKCGVVSRTDLIHTKWRGLANDPAAV